jgi:hypothetical protein
MRFYIPWSEPWSRFSYIPCGSQTDPLPNVRNALHPRGYYGRHLVTHLACWLRRRIQRSWPGCADRRGAARRSSHPVFVFAKTKNIEHNLNAAGNAELIENPKQVILTVCSVSPRHLAISRLDKPSATQRTTSCSRVEGTGSPADSTGRIGFDSRKTSIT